MNRAMRVLAAVTLLLVALAVYLNPFVPRAQIGPLDPVRQYLPSLVLFHAYLLGFATGIVVLVAAAQRRHWRWFVPSLPVVALTAYSPLLGVILLSVLLRSQSVAAPSMPIQTQAMLDLVSIVGFPAVMGLLALFYAARARARVILPDLEVSFIGDAVS